MPSLASMRSIDPTETFQPLGPATRPVPPAAPTPVSKPTGTPGVVQLPDGKLATELPLPGSKPAVKVHDSICEFPSYYTEAAQRLSGSLRPNASGEAPYSTASDKTYSSGLEVAILVARQQPGYPEEGTAWTPHDIEKAEMPAGARYALLRCGEVRNAADIGTWGKLFLPVYEVVAWK